MGLFSSSKSKGSSSSSQVSRNRAAVAESSSGSTQVSQVGGYSVKTSGRAAGKAFKGGAGTWADEGGRAAAVSQDGTAWSRSIASGGSGGGDSSSSSRQVSKRGSKQSHVFTYGNAVAGVGKGGGTFVHAKPGGYGEAAYRDGDKFGVTVAYGGDKKGSKPMRLSKPERKRIDGMFSETGYGSDSSSDSDSD